MNIADSNTAAANPNSTPSHLFLQTLSQSFPESDWIVAQAAMAQYNLRNFDDAQELFEDLIERDPHRIEVSFEPCCTYLA